MFSYGPLHMDEQVLDDQLELIYRSSVRTQDVDVHFFYKMYILIYM